LGEQLLDQRGNIMAERSSKFSFLYRLVVGVTVSLWVLAFVVLTYWYYNI
jgi:hypothetical protein